MSLSIFQIYKGQFWLLCLSSLFFFASFSMIIAELPAYLDSLGGGAYKGGIIGWFAAMAALSRPISGKLADRVGRVPVIRFGALVCVACGLLYPYALTVSAFLLLRLLHGLSTGFTPTGSSSYVADLVPAGRRGEALGIHTLCANIGGAYGPSLGSDIAQAYSIDTMFQVSAVLAALSLVVLLGLKETLPEPQPFRWSLFRLRRDELIEPRVLVPAAVMVLFVWSYGLNLTVIPDFASQLGMGNKGDFFLYMTVASIFVRISAGQASDRWGRVPVLLVSSGLLALAMGTIAMADSPAWLLAGGCLFGVAHGMGSPTIFAWTIDLADPGRLGRAIATTFIALEFGVMMGSFVAGWVYGNEPDRIPAALLVGAGCALLAFLVLVLHRGRSGREAIGAR
jgi:MFS family permease